MAAYASVVSVMNFIADLQNHPNPPINLPQHHLQSLSQYITFLKYFLEDYTSEAIQEAAHGLEARIADVAYAAQDVIESQIVIQINSKFPTDTMTDSSFYSPFLFDDEPLQKYLQKHLQRLKTQKNKRRRKHQMWKEIVDLSKNLEKIVSDAGAIVKEETQIKKKLQNQDQQVNTSLIHHSSRITPSVELKNHAMVGLDHVLKQVMEKLLDSRSSLQIIPIVGMGGIGKTTLANVAYEDMRDKHRFDIQLWVTASQDYDVKEIFLKILDQKKELASKVLGQMKREWKDLRTMSKEDIGDVVRNILFDRRYLVILDDVWEYKCWDEIRRFFPDQRNSSRIMITTRHAKQLSDDNIIRMEFLNDDQSWELLCKVVFGDEACPNELEEGGKKIAKNCKGLPLSIVVIGGLLAKSSPTQENWMSIANNLNPSLNSERQDLCLRILYTSYKHLPVHLKPCFLYMGTLDEDSEIRRSVLINLWVCEGFVKPKDC